MNEFNEMINDSKPTLVDFFATWCGPCKMQSPILEQVKATLGDSVNIIKIDVDRNPELSERYSIRSVPTLIVFKSGEALWRGYGVHQADQLEAKLKEHIG
ncbi:MAG: thioredoxin [Bacteroidales bacterium]|nr:thioredoxin [Bacteroidales bacterium]MBD5308690.1 thioredoxin [Bacteroides sp.]MDE6825188.1 thioredoxin [Paramuribaculum sp.]MDE7470637.1 thioredoxin [Paramuribaculum sp.]